MTHSRSSHLVRAAALAALCAFLPVACSGDDDDGGDAGAASDDADAQAYVDAAAASLTADEELAFDEATASCVATAVVDAVGAGNLARSGVTPDQFAEAESFDVAGLDIPDDLGTQLGEAFDGCGVARAFTSVFAAGLGVELQAEARTCLDENVDGRAVADAFAGALFAPTDAALDDAGAGFEQTLQTSFVDAVVACPPVVTTLFLAGAPGTVTPETEACVSALVEADPERVRAALGGDSAAGEALGTEIGTRCGATLGG